MEPSVFHYLDYRQYLRDICAHKRESSNTFSLEALSRRTGCLTKSHISLIMAGKRQLTCQRAVSLGRALGLKDRALSYYEQLVQFNQAKDDVERTQHLTAMMGFIRRAPGGNLSLHSYSILENWHCLAIRELARFDSFNPEPSAISEKLRGLITPSEARRAFLKLIDTGHLIKRGDGSAWKPSNKTLRTSDEVNSLAIRKYHQSCLDLGKKILEIDPVDKREFGSVNLNIKPEDLVRLKDLIKNFREQILALSHSDATPGSVLTQVNIQMFHLSN